MRRERSQAATQTKEMQTMRFFFLPIAGLMLLPAGCAGPAYEPHGPVVAPYSAYVNPYETFEPEPFYTPYAVFPEHEFHERMELGEEREEHESAAEERQETPQQERQEEHEEHEHAQR
jgi:hypothetical protein